VALAPAFGALPRDRRERVAAARALAELPVAPAASAPEPPPPPQRPTRLRKRFDFKRRAAEEATELLERMHALDRQIVEGGDAAAMDRAVDALAEEVHASDNLRAHEVLVVLIAKLRHHQRSLDECAAAMAKFGPTPDLCLERIDPTARIGRTEEALALGAECLALYQEGQAPAHLHNILASVHVLRGEGDEAAREAYLGFAGQPDPRLLEELLRSIRVREGAAAAARALALLDELALPEGVADAARAPARRALEDDSADRPGRRCADGRRGATPLAARLGENLRRMAALVRGGQCDPALPLVPGIEPAGRACRTRSPTRRASARRPTSTCGRASSGC
jgi:hypothetical protein